MRAWTLVSCVALAAALTGCKDENAKPIVNDDVNWQVGCSSGGCGLDLAGHDQASAEEDFEIKCSKSGSNYSITLRDPGNAERPDSTLKLTGINLAAGACDVSVTEPEEVGFNPSTIVGSCAEMGCSIEGAEDTDGWDLVLRIRCTKMELPRMEMSPIYTLQASGHPSDPVQISVDNCD